MVRAIAVGTLVFLVTACGRVGVESNPGTMPRPSNAEPQQPADITPATAFGRSPSTDREPDDSLADSRALDSLQEAEPDASLPELDESELGQPASDLNVEAFASHPRVQYYIDYFTGKAHDRFQIWLERMPRYEELIRDQLAAHDLPGDLVYLALIESGFSPVATSRSRAVGMWQFMRATGRGYGLTINAWVDERRDPVRATRAAADYLSDLTDRFGSNYLAAAAYNGGPGRVGRGLLKMGAVQGAGDAMVDPASDEMFFELAATSSLHQETKDYVPKLIAATLVAKHPAVYGFSVPDDVQPFPTDSVVVAGGTGLDLIAKLADTTLSAIQTLNPAILRGITPPGRRYPVRLPAGKMAAVTTAYRATPPSERPAVLTHVVRRGETVSGIASKYGVSTNLLMSSNRVARARSLQVGTTLYIPVSGSGLPSTAFYEGGPASTAPRNHIVRSGETLGGIAHRYNVSIATLRANNGIGSNNLIRAGQKLVIRVGSVNKTQYHVVRRGETVGGIAEHYRVGQSELIRANRLGRRAVIKVGQRLRIPG